MSQASPIDLVLPVHNEADSIGDVIREFHEVVAGGQQTPIRFVVCEDGSSDGSADVIRALGKEIPIHLISSPSRKGYSRAVVDGLQAATSNLISFIDSDGQCDPNDFHLFLKEIGNYDLVIGYRAPRRDPWFRILMSKSFGAVYGLILGRTTIDPSCPYLLVHRESLLKILRGNPGILKQGFWWEFIARARNAGLRIKEVPVNHRNRLAGQTRVYRWKKIPGIAYEHLLGLFTLRKELRSLAK